VLHLYCAPYSSKFEAKNKSGRIGRGRFSAILPRGCRIHRLRNCEGDGAIFYRGAAAG
jgi:hypothetical protein